METTTHSSEKDSNKLYVEELLAWIKEKSFVVDEKYNWERENGAASYALVKGNFRIEIQLNWDILYSSHASSLCVSLLDCTDECYHDGSSGFQGWMGRKNIISFKKRISREMLDALCEHYEI